MSYAAKMHVACNITGERIRKLRAAAKARGRMVEAWCGGMPYLTVYPDGRLKLSGRGMAGTRRRRRRR